MSSKDQPGKSQFDRIVSLRRQHFVIEFQLVETSASDLPGYLADSVITGPGSFVISPSSPREYAKAIRRKIVLEISDRRDGGDLDIRQASASMPVVR